MAELKLIDFGFASFVAPGKESMWDQIGTPSYMAPELWSDRAKEYDSSVDMWALGVVCYMLLSGKRPFHHQAFTCMRCMCMCMCICICMCMCMCMCMACAWHVHCMCMCIRMAYELPGYHPLARTARRRRA